MIGLWQNTNTSFPHIPALVNNSGFDIVDVFKDAVRFLLLSHTLHHSEQRRLVLTVVAALPRVPLSVVNSGNGRHVHRWRRYLCSFLAILGLAPGLDVYNNFDSFGCKKLVNFAQNLSSVQVIQFFKVLPLIWFSFYREILLQTFFWWLVYFEATTPDTTTNNNNRQQQQQQQRRHQHQTTNLRKKKREKRSLRSKWK